MKNILSRKFLILFMLTIGMVFGACAYNPGVAQVEATATPWIVVITYTPTEDLGVIETAVVETFSAQLTETRLAMPTETPVPPTETPTNTFTPTATNTYTATATRTVVSRTPTSAYTKTATPKPTDSKWSCDITFQLIENNKTMNPHEDFDGRWTIKNTGKEIWLTTDVDYRYMSGTEMQKYNKVYDLPNEVDPGESITITVDMQAPGSSGYYETFWALARHADGFCSLPTRIRVK
jgi:hypothetical protein